ncbi:MAG: hypothetical protein ABII25_01710 [bacterium]
MININYKFKFKDMYVKEFDINLDDKSLNLVKKRNSDIKYPAWTELNYSKCPNCPLNENEHKHCPIAVTFTDVIYTFKGFVSYQEADVTVETKDRTYIKHVPLQKGLSSLMGIYMVTSGCPIMEKLKPMVKFHLPFASGEETSYRMVTMYLLTQFFKYKNGKEPDWGLENLVKIYDDIRIVNKSFCGRVSKIIVEDAGVNALVILDCFADQIIFSITENVLKQFAGLFEKGD